MPQAKGPRLRGRDGAIWVAYISGETQRSIAARHGLTQQTVSEILQAARAEVSADEDAAQVREEHLEAVRMVRRVMMAQALTGDVASAREARQLLAHHAKVLGLYADVPLRVVMKKQVELDGSLVADALSAALGVLGLTEDQRIEAYAAAQARLLGGDTEPEPAPVPKPVSDTTTEQLRRMLDGIHEEYGEDDDESE